MLKHAVWPWVVIVFLGSLPFLALIAVGGWWLWEQQLLLLWLSLSVSCSGVAWIVARQFNKHQKKPFSGSRISSKTPFSQRDEEAWKAVEMLANQIKEDKLGNFDQLDSWLQLGRRILEVVAKHYRPHTKHPELDIPATELLRIVELVSHDMHRLMFDNLPFSHVITLADGLNLHRWIDRLSDANTTLRLGRMIMNPVSGVLNEAKSYAQDKAAVLTLPHLQRWLLDMYIQKVGEYAILLYSGRMAVEAEKAETLSSQSRQDYQQAQEQQANLEREPLRVLVAGQTNAGKSTLINTLFDKPRAATDVVSCTAELMPYQLERDGQFSGLIFDTPGYGEKSNWIHDNRDELDKTDLVILVCHANNAARTADRHFLKEFQHHFVEQANRKIPPIIIVATHIDELRPLREWNPPYDVAEPNGIKAANIRAAMDAIQQDLALPENTSIVPVCLSNNEGIGAYNVESIVEAMGQQMDEANRARLLRCLKSAMNREKWTQVWRQTGNSSLWLLRTIGNVLP